ncbi:hypothetical protein LAZ67_2001870, partial [Cordylochernes scorpioides]
MAHCLQISHGSAYEITQNRIEFHILCARWVPKQLTQLHKQQRLNICQQLGEETAEYGEWKHLNSPCKKKFKSQPSTIKLMITVFFFFYSQGVVLEHYQESATTINSARYSEMLTDKLNPTIRSKRRGLLSKGVVLLHDNACPHTAAHTVETFQKLNFKVLTHPLYSPDLSPSDFPLFVPLKEALGVDKTVKEAVNSWLAAQPKIFFYEGFRKIVQQRTECIENKEFYDEKIMY